MIFIFTESHMDQLEAHMRLLETTKATYHTEYESIPNATGSLKPYPNLVRVKSSY